MAIEGYGGYAPPAPGDPNGSQPGTVMYQGYPQQVYPQQVYPQQGYPPHGYPQQFQGYPPQMYASLPQPQNNSLCLRISIVLVSLLVAVECLFFLALLSNPWFRGGSTTKSYVAVMALHCICLAGGLINAFAMCCKAHRVLKYTQYTLSVFGIFYLGLLIGLVSEIKDFPGATVAFLIAFAIIGFGGNFMIRKYLQGHNANSEVTNPSVQLARVADHVPVVAIQIHPPVQPQA